MQIHAKLTRLMNYVLPSGIAFHQDCLLHGGYLHTPGYECFRYLEMSLPVQVGISSNAVYLEVLHLSRPVYERGDGADQDHDPSNRKLLHSTSCSVHVLFYMKCKSLLMGVCL